MKKDEIKKIYLKKIQLLKKYNEHYYDRNESLSSDYEFDLIKKEITNLENNNDFLENKESPNLTVGFRPSKK